MMGYNTQINTTRVNVQITMVVKKLFTHKNTHAHTHTICICIYTYIKKLISEVSH